MQAEELIQEGRIDEALAVLQGEVRAAPADPKLRICLFQLLAVMGQWNRAMNQLKVVDELDKSASLMVQVCRPALLCEALRASVFSGERHPLVLGNPSEWVTWMIEALHLAGQGHDEASQELRSKALESAPAIAGMINEQPFEWIADADPRLGPIFEAIVDGKYYWVPCECVREIVLQKPSDLRDLVWIPVRFVWSNGGDSVGLMPTRYPGSEAAKDAAIRLARKTDWSDRQGVQIGLGQRLLATDREDYPLLETRRVTLDSAAPVGAETGDDG